MGRCGKTQRDTGVHGWVRNDAGGWCDADATQKQVSGDTEGMGGHIFVCIAQRENAKKHKWSERATGS